MTIEHSGVDQPKADYFQLNLPIACDEPNLEAGVWEPMELHQFFFMFMSWVAADSVLAAPPFSGDFDEDWEATLET